MLLPYLVSQGKAGIGLLFFNFLAMFSTPEALLKGKPPGSAGFRSERAYSV